MGGTSQPKTKPVAKAASKTTPAPVPIEAKVSIVLVQAHKMTVKNNDQLLAVSEFLKTIKALRAEVDATFDPIISKAHEAHREALAQKKKVEAPLVQAEAAGKPLIAGYLAEQERKRREEQVRLQREADEKAAAEEEKKRLALAEAANEDGDIERAVEIMLDEPIAPVVAARVMVRANVPKLDGVSMRENWTAEVTDMKALVAAVAAGQVPLIALQANTMFLGQQARAMKAGLNYPGVKAVAANSIAARG